MWTAIIIAMVAFSYWIMQPSEPLAITRAGFYDGWNGFWWDAE